MARRFRTLPDLPAGDTGTPEGLVGIVRLLARQAAREAMEHALRQEEQVGEEEDRKDR